MLIFADAVLLQMVTTPIKDFYSHVKTCLSSLTPTHPPQATSYRMTLNYMGCSACMSLNCEDPSSCMMINCPPHCTVQSCVQSHDEPCDCPTGQTDDTMNCASHKNPCPDLDPSSSTDSTQTHDSPVTPESPHYLPSPAELLEEGTMQDSTQVGVTQVGTNGFTTQVRTDDSLAYDSLVTTLSRLSLKPDPDPLSDLHHDSLPLRPDLDPIRSSDRTPTHT